jgi:hypothetical protein
MRQEEQEQAVTGVLGPWQATLWASFCVTPDTLWLLSSLSCLPSSLLTDKASVYFFSLELGRIW